MPYIAHYNWEQEVPNIKTLGLEGKSMSEIALVYQISRQRMKQVIDRLIPNWIENYGKSVLKRKKLEKYFQQWGERQATDLYQIQRTKFRNKKSWALRNGISWTLSFGELDWPTYCPILGIELNYFAERTEEGSPSFDRIDNTKGYEKGNVHIVSWRANRIKNDGTSAEHRKIAEYLDKILGVNSCV